MSKYCKNCGTVLSDEIIYCHFCGAKQEMSAVPESQYTSDTVPQRVPISTPVDGSRKIRPKKWLAIAGGILGALLIAAVIVFLLWPKPEKAVDKYNKVLSGDFEALEDLAPKEYWIYAAEQYNTTKSELLNRQEDSLEEYYDKLQDSAKEQYGKNFKQSLEIVHKEKLDEDKVEDIAEALEDMYDIDQDRVKSIYRMILKITYEGSKDSYFFSGVASAVQIDSKWYLIHYRSSDDEYVVYFIASGDLLNIPNY